jgi:uridylate kinase
VRRKPKYKRIILKLSGEALARKNGFGIDYETVKILAKQIKEIHDIGVEVGIVMRGREVF